ncbi:BTE_collapsed_G0044440.mRNA.1.CDS.1 [Saccharomyces cerevisiae]|nr:BTE_collapsed_G0044440.mRNA.1.CDS.1 [Saccharomyces cerevisiae]
MDVTPRPSLLNVLKKPWQLLRLQDFSLVAHSVASEATSTYCFSKAYTTAIFILSANLDGCNTATVSSEVMLGQTSELGVFSKTYTTSIVTQCDGSCFDKAKTVTSEKVHK